MADTIYVLSEGLSLLRRSYSDDVHVMPVLLGKRIPDPFTCYFAAQDALLHGPVMPGFLFIFKNFTSSYKF